MDQKNNEQPEDKPKNGQAFDNMRAARPDLCIGEDSRSIRNSPEPQPPPVQDDFQRRDENPFSFKRFLNQDGRGARRKEYSPDGAPILHTPEMSSVLPDFVQDHLVVEQCYLSSSHENNSPLLFDLPRPAEERVDPIIAMSLPDFLSDGPIHNQRCDDDEKACAPPNNVTNSSNVHMSTSSLSRNDSERLQREVDSLRRQLQERNRRIQVLESDISLLHCRDARETNSLEQALQKVENNLRQTSRQMVAAEKTVSKLKAENNMLKARLEMIEGSACGGETCASTAFTQSSRSTRLAQDLRGAASAAEIHVRALMSGIENLKLLASSVEDSPACAFDDMSASGRSGPAL